MLGGISARLSKMMSSAPTSAGFSTAVTEPTTSATVCGLKLSSCILNSSNPFATTVADLKLLEASKAGAVATRTACPGFKHDDQTMKWATPDDANTINCLGYSPHTFEYYCESLRTALASSTKPGWMSISGVSNAPSCVPFPFLVSPPFLTPRCVRNQLHGTLPQTLARPLDHHLPCESLAPKNTKASTR